MPTLTGVNIDRRQKLQKTIATIEFTPLDYAEYEISSKLKHLPFFVQNYGLKDDRCQHWQVSRITENYCHQWIQHLQIVHYAKFYGKWSTSFPVPCSPFPFLKIVLFWLCIYIRKWLSLACLIPVPIFSLLSWFLYSSIYSKSTKSMKPNGNISTEWCSFFCLVKRTIS